MGKYFKYAIGEIFLVVIGILIAVQLNNWNESRVKHNEIGQLLMDLNDFLDTQKVYMSWDISITKKADSILGVILFDSLNKDQINSLPSLDDILFNPSKIPFKKIPEHQIGFSNIDNLINRKEDFPKRFWSMIYELESLKKYSQDIKHYSEEASKASTTYRNFLLENHPDFFVLDSTDSLSFNQLLLTEASSKTRLIELKDYLNEMARAYNYYIFNSAHISADINHLINEKDVEEIKELWRDYNLQQLQITDCSDNNSNNQTNKRRLRFLVFNNASSEIQYEIINKNDEILRSQTLKRKGVYFLHTVATANNYVRYIKNDSCYLVVEPKPFSYFIID